MLTQSFSFSETSLFPSNGATLIVGIRRCMDLTCNTTSTPFPPNHCKPNTIAFQKVMAKQLAISAWQARWCNTDGHPPCPPESSCPPSQIHRYHWCRTSANKSQAFPPSQRHTLMRPYLFLLPFPLTSYLHTLHVNTICDC